MLHKLLERMLATRLSWWLERYIPPTEIRFRPHLGTEEYLWSTLVLLGGRSHRIYTLLTMDVHKAYDHVSHSVILAILE